MNYNHVRFWPTSRCSLYTSIHVVVLVDTIPSVSVSKNKSTSVKDMSPGTNYTCSIDH